MKMELEPLSPLLGVTVRNRDVSLPFCESDRAKYLNLIEKYHLLYFPDQQLNQHEHVCYVSLFGTVAQWADGFYFTFVPDDGSELGFHSDFSFSRFPLPYISLYGVESGEGAASTLFVNGVLAYETMPERLRAKLNDRTVLHASDVTHAGMTSSGSRNHAGREAKGTCPGTHHPAIMQHPRSGASVLFVNQYLSRAIDGMSCHESDAILCELFQWLYREENIYEHKWRKGDLILFDNVALQHSRARGNARRLRRVVVSEVPISELFPKR